MATCPELWQQMLDARAAREAQQQVVAEKHADTLVAQAEVAVIQAELMAAQQVLIEKQSAENAENTKLQQLLMTEMSIGGQYSMQGCPWPGNA